MTSQETLVIRRIILKQRVTEDDVADLAMTERWVPLGMRPASERNPYAFVWEDEIEDVQIHLVWDNYLQMPYLYLRGRDVACVERRLREKLETWSYEDILRQVETADRPEDLVDGICRIALSREPESGRSRDPLLRAGAHEHPGVRRAFVMAA